jgi:hypothetical protein
MKFAPLERSKQRVIKQPAGHRRAGGARKQAGHTLFFQYLFNDAMKANHSAVKQ